MSISRRNLVRLLPAMVVLVAACAYFNTFYNAKKYYAEGVTMKEQGQQTQAKAKFDKAVEKSARVIQRWPRSQWVDDALLLIGMSYYQQSYYTKAVRHFDQLALAFPKSKLVAQAELYRGLALLSNKDYGAGRVVLDGVKQRFPRLADAAAFHLARSFVDRAEHERAADSLAGFVERYPRSKYVREAVRLLAEECLALGRGPDAERWFVRYARLVDEPKERTRARLKAASAQYQQGRYDEAIVGAKDVLGRYAEFDEETNMLIGRATAAAGRSQDAVKDWAKVRGATDYGAEAAFLIGKYYEERAVFDTARAYYDTARTRKADSDHGVQAVKRLSLLDAFGEQKTGTRTPAEAAFLLAEVYNLNLGDYDKAMNMYQRVHDSFPETDWAAKALFARAWILRVMKHDTTTAEPVLRQVIAEYPETEYADESRRWLGLPVPKRPKKEVKEVKAETTETKAETLAAAPETKEQPRTGPESSLDELEQEPRMPRGPGSDLLRERLAERSGSLPTPEPESAAIAPKPTLGETLALPEPVRDTSAKVWPKETEPNREPTPLPVVHFGTDSFAVSAADAESLKVLAARLRESDSAIVVTGYCDPRASERYNQTLGMRRAEAVRDLLVAHGVDAKRVEVRSRGEMDTISTGPADYWRDRRAEFRLQ